MTDNQSEQEPSIEEILASIRQIISDEDEVEADESKDDSDSQKIVEDPIDPPGSDVLELTDEDVAEEELVVEDEVITESVAEEDVIEELPIEVDMVDKEEYLAPSKDEIAADLEAIRAQSKADTVPSDILSSSVQAATMDSLTKLTKRMPIDRSRSYDGVTLEDIVRELLHPMLREWMDDNLPRMVERIVQKELEKLARRALDD